MFFTKDGIGRLGKTGAVVCGLLMFQSLATAGDWSDVLSLKPGAGVGVDGDGTGATGKAKTGIVYGSLKTVDANSLTVVASGNTFTFPKPDVHNIYSVTDANRRQRKIGTGFLIAFGGLSILEGVLAIKSAHDASNTPNATLQFNPIALVLPIGAAIGAITFLRKGRGEKIYP